MGSNQEVKIYFDKESDYIEILFKIKEGFFQETEFDCIMKKVDMEGNIIGFTIQNISKLETNPLTFLLKSAA